MLVHCEIELVIPDAASLKDKRQVLRSVIERIRARCLASVAETDFQDVWQRAVIEIAIVGSDHRFLEQQVGRIRGILDDAAAELSESVLAGIHRVGLMDHEPPAICAQAKDVVRRP